MIVWLVDISCLWMAGSVLGSLTLQQPSMTSKKLSQTGTSPGKGTEPNLNLEKLRIDLEAPPKGEALDEQA